MGTYASDRVLQGPEKRPLAFTCHAPPCHRKIAQLQPALPDVPDLSPVAVPTFPLQTPASQGGPCIHPCAKQVVPRVYTDRSPK